MSVNDLQMKELQDQLEAEQYFSVSRSFDSEIFLGAKFFHQNNSKGVSVNNNF